MSRYPAVWLVSFTLQALGTIWVFITIIAAIAVAVSGQQAGTISVAGQYEQIATAFVNATAIGYLVALVLSLLIGLAFIALGQMSAMLVRIETNTRTRGPAYDVPAGDQYDNIGAPERRTTQKQGQRPMSEADRRALEQRRRFQNPKRE